MFSRIWHQKCEIIQIDEFLYILTSKLTLTMFGSYYKVYYTVLYIPEYKKIVIYDTLRFLNWYKVIEATSGSYLDRMESFLSRHDNASLTDLIKEDENTDDYEVKCFFSSLKQDRTSTGFYLSGHHSYEFCVITILGWYQVENSCERNLWYWREYGCFSKKSFMQTSFEKSKSPRRSPRLEQICSSRWRQTYFQRYSQVIKNRK